MWEIPILRTISGLWTEYQLSMRGLTFGELVIEGKKTLAKKFDKLEAYPRIATADFAMRRAAHPAWHDIALDEYIKRLPHQLAGTSNVYYAYKKNIKQIGTMAHEMLMAMLALVARPEMAQSEVLHKWLMTYKDKLGIALTDTYTTEAFWHDFDVVLARAYAGLRHDSACPYAFAKDAIKHYEKMNIDPVTKTVVWSDSLNVDLIIDLWLNFVGRIGCGFGWGGNFGNDIWPFLKLNIVMKLMYLEGKPLCKKSDVPGKVMEAEPGVSAMISDAYREAHGLELPI